MAAEQFMWSCLQATSSAVRKDFGEFVEKIQDFNMEQISNKLELVSVVISVKWQKMLKSYS